jgi:lon-related putative ATP-dependent protease
MTTMKPLNPELLRTRCDPDQFSFKTTAELEPLSGNLGQERAIEALRFGVGIRHEGYNLFAYGPSGTGKSTLVRRYAEEHARRQPAPDDWCYINNFSDPRNPHSLRLPPGRAVVFREQMERLIGDLRASIKSAFESEDYIARKQSLEAEFNERQEKAFNQLQEKARGKGTTLIRTPMGFAFAPTQRGEVISPEVFRQWPEEHQEKIKKAVEELEDELQQTMKQVPQWQREHREKLRTLDNDVTSFAVGHLIKGFRGEYENVSDVQRYLDEVEKDVVENSNDFRTAEEAAGEEGSPPLGLRRSLAGPPTFRQYQVNVIVNHSKATTAAVIYEDHPTQPNLIGRIEHMAQFGALTTDFNLIKAGALHKANGGYLILDARKVLMQPFAWEELKHALRSREIRIQGITESLGWTTTISLDPEPIPLEVKVVLVGEPILYYLLSQLDPDFVELFKVAVDFDDRFDRNSENHQLYARLIASITKKEGLKALKPTGVAAVIEYAARRAADSEKLSLHMRPIVDLLCEANYWAQQTDNELIDDAIIRRAIDAKIFRSDRNRERIYEEIHRGTLLIDTEGSVAGRVNGLSVLQSGEFAFGQPSRITARVRLGRGEVVDIEREVELGGRIHSKGVLILSGFLGERFGRRAPLALSASLVFEQSYGGVDGDSASSAEVYALLSALSGIPIRQSLAVTGSVNQQGEVQAIGGVNEKIQGFFDVCNRRGLTGEHGVLIPASNVKHLMLREEIVEAVAADRFQVYAVGSIDQGIEILTGIPAGEADSEGRFVQGSVNAAVQAQLEAFADAVRAFSTADRKEGQ